LLINISGQKLIFPYYHAVSDEALSHIHNVFPYRRTSCFIRDLDYLLRHFRPAGIEELNSWQENNSYPDKPYFFLSFDDGLREVYDIVAPILNKKGVPATFFINNDFVDNRDLFYRYKISLIIDRLDTVRYSPATSELMQSRFHLPGKEKRHILKFIREIRYDRKEILNEIAGILDLDFNAFLKVKKPYMTSSQINELAKQGFNIGAHSKDHPDFLELNTREQLEQFRQSIEFVKKEFGQEHGLFAFPFGDEGVSKDFFTTIGGSGEARSSFGTRGLKKDPVHFHYQRIAMETPVLPAFMRLKAEYFLYILKTPFGKNIVIR
jgi:peptidoglycan/xylan/chitin deacetylase (PgdA/CDA1 family)